MEWREEGPEATEGTRELHTPTASPKVILWRGLRTGPNRWRRSHPFQGFFLDLYCEAARLAVECNRANRDPAYDARQDAKVAEAGVLTLRFSNVEIGAEPERCLAEIRRVEAERAEMFRRS